MVAVYNSVHCSFYAVTHSMSTHFFVMFKVFPKNRQQERNREEWQINRDCYNRVEAMR